MSSIDSEFAAMQPPIGFTYDAEAKRLFGTVTFEGPAICPDVDGPAAFSEWTPEAGVRVRFDATREYTPAEVKDFNIELMMMLMRFEGLDPSRQDPDSQSQDPSAV